MEKRILLATLLTVVVMFLFSYYQAVQIEKDRKLHPEKYQQVAAGEKTPTEHAPIPPVGATLSEPSEPAKTPVASSTSTVETPPAAAALIASSAATGPSTRVDTNIAEIVLNATGGNVGSILLLQYPEHVPNREQFECKMSGIRNMAERSQAERDYNAIVAYEGKLDLALRQLEMAEAGGDVQAIALARKRIDEVKAIDLVPFPRINQSLPLALRIKAMGQTFADNDLVYEMEQSGVDGASTTVVFRAGAGRIGVEKRFTFYRDSYRSDLEIVLRNNGTDRLPVDFGDTTLLWEGGLGRFLASGYQMDVGLYRVGNRFYSPDGLAKAMDKGDIPKDRAVDLAMVQSKYFLAGIFPESKTGVFFPVLPTTSEIEAHKQDRFQPPYTVGLRQNIRPLEPGEEQREHYVLYLGPKEYDLLSSVAGLPAQEIIYQKTFILEWIHLTWICKYILNALKFFHRFTGNWGVDIILLVFIVKAFLYPITLRQHKHQRKMRDLQPQIKAIQEKYKASPLEGQRKVSELMKKHGARPTAGCLPALLQMPIFLGLYFTLYYAIELRGAPFFGWINDLSEPDSLISACIAGSVWHLRVLPLVNAAVTFLTMSQTPMPDPKQAQMFKFMPIMMTFLFWGFPSGLVLYWTVQGLIQYVTVLLMEHVHFKEENGGKKDAK